jgi:hypothetical protein
VHLFDQLGEKTLSDFVSEFLVPKLSTWQIITDKEDLDHPASTHLPSTQGLLTRIVTQGTTLHRLERPRRGPLRLNHHPKDSRGPWCAPQCIDNYIYEYIYIYNKQVEIESLLGSCCNRLDYIPCNIVSLGYKKRDIDTP